MMNNRGKAESWHFILVTLLLCAFALPLFTGCAAKDRDSKVVTVQAAGATTASATQTKMEAAIKRVAEFLAIYFPEGELTHDGLQNVFIGQKDMIEKFFAGTGFTAQEFMDLLFKFQAKNEKFTFDDLADGLEARIPTFKWVPSGDGIPGDELQDKIVAAYPEASPNVVHDLRATLENFDADWAGGNQDGLISRKELSVAGVLIGVLNDTDFSKGIQPPASAGQASLIERIKAQLSIETIEHKLNQQMYGRTAVFSYKDLSQIDQKLEWMQFMLRFVLTDRAVGKFGEGGHLRAYIQSEALSSLGPKYDEKWTVLSSFYDSSFMAGNGDKMLNLVETLNLVTDHEYAARMISGYGADFTKMTKSGAIYLLTHLSAQYPRTGWDIFLQGNGFGHARTGRVARMDFWKRLPGFDKADKGGNANGKTESGELTMILAHARLVEIIFAVLDKDKSGDVSKTEVKQFMHSDAPEAKEVAKFFKDHPIEDVLDYFFADVGLEGGSDIGNAISLSLSGKKKIERLTPYEFFSRLEKILPGALKK